MHRIVSFEKKFSGEYDPPPHPLAMYCNTSNSLNNYTLMFEYGFTPLH